MADIYICAKTCKHRKCLIKKVSFSEPHFSGYYHGEADSKDSYLVLWNSEILPRNYICNAKKNNFCNLGI